MSLSVRQMHEGDTNTRGQPGTGQEIDRRRTSEILIKLRWMGAGHWTRSLAVLRLS